MKISKNLVVLVILTVAVLAGYINIFPGAFIHDDISEIVENPYIKDPAFIGRIFTSPAWAFEYSEERVGVSNYYRPLQYLTYMGIYRFWGLNPIGYRLFKLLLHLATVILVFSLLKHYFIGFRAALAAAIFFALHPIHTEAVTWISGITDALSTPLILAAFMMYLKYRSTDGVEDKPGAGGSSGTGWYIASCGVFLTALFAKETAAVLIPLLILYDLLFARKFFCLKRFASWFPYGALFFVYLAFRINAIGAFRVEGSKFPELNLFHRLLNPLYLAASYFFKALVPVNQSGWHVFNPVLGAGDLRFILSAALLAAIAVGVVLLWKAGRKNELFFLLWFFITLLPVVVFFRHIGYNVFAERYLYLPGVGFCALLSKAVSRLPRRGAVAVVVILAGAGLFLTVRRNSVWRDRFAFWTATAKASPDSSIARNNLGVQYHLREDYVRAEKEYREAARLMDENPTPRINLALIHSDRGEYGEALAWIEEALSIRPDSADAYETLGGILIRMERPEEALEALRTAVMISLPKAKTLVKLGRAHREIGDFERAAVKFRQALNLDPGSISVRIVLGALHERAGDLVEAEKAFREAARLSPDDAEILINLASIYRRTGRPEKAVETLLAARAADPDSAEARYRLAAHYSEAGRFPEAVRKYGEAIRLDPRHPGAHIGLGVLLGMAGKYGNAEQMLKRAVEIEPDSVDGHFNLAILYRKQGREEDFRRQAAVLHALSPESAEELMK